MTKGAAPMVKTDRCPHCKATAAEVDPLFFEADDGHHCNVCGGEVEFSASGRAVKPYRKPKGPRQ